MQTTKYKIGQKLFLVILEIRENTHRTTTPVIKEYIVNGYEVVTGKNVDILIDEKASSFNLDDHLSELKEKKDVLYRLGDSRCYNAISLVEETVLDALYGTTAEEAIEKATEVVRSAQIKNS